MSAWLFLVLAAVTVALSLVVVLHKNPVYSALGLVATLVLLAVFFVGLDAHLVAALQIIVNAGAIVVLFLFVIMLLNLRVEARAVPNPVVAGLAGLASLALAAGLFCGLGRAPALPGPAVDPGYGGTLPVAERLFTAYIIPFELTSLLLTVAVVGAVALGKKGGRRG
jgi:NADH-quinone oxidoreductase subunit J